MSERFASVLLLPLRLLAGVMLAMSGYKKFTDGWLHGDALLKTLNGWLDAGKTYHFFLPVIETARVHPKIFGTLVTTGELVIGVALVLGLLTRLLSFLGAVMLFSFALGAGQGLSPPGDAILLGSILATFVLAPPGRALGVDQTMRGRLPSWMI
ncbi:MAG TPA: DoxX family membrane protein, partial [Polyangia bacterium]|nr:DoxX family membrane protein [Polyangia bacterium]